MSAPPDAEVQAAGGVLVRRTDGGLELLLCHRPRYDDWSFPKGKLDAGETHADAARREILEETGLDVELGAALPSVYYRDAKGRSKAVRYWVATVSAGTFVPNPEVDEIRWVPPDEALRLLSYIHDRRLVPAAVEVASVTG